MTTQVEVSGSVLIRGPAIDVFERVCDVSAASEWVPFCNHSRISTRSDLPTPGGVGVGMQAVHNFQLGLAKVEVVQKVTAFRWGRRFAFTTEESGRGGGGMLGRVTSRLTPKTRMRFDFVPAVGATVVTLTVKIRAALGADAVQPHVTHAVFLALNELKRWVEEHHPHTTHRPWIFFNYRRGDSPFGSDRLHSDLVAEFGATAVFRDITEIPGGATFVSTIDQAVSSARAVVATIGPRWLAELKKRHGRPDFVALELLGALRKGVPVYPVLLGDTSVPTEDDLGSLKGLARLNWRRVRREPDWAADARKVVDDLWAIARPGTGGASSG